MQKISTARERRQRKSRRKIAELGAIRLSVNRTPRHIYAQIFSHDGASVLACASSVEKGVRGASIKGKQSVAKEVGKLVAERAKKKGILKVAFDRSGYKYHGRVKALAEGARESGLEF